MKLIPYIIFSGNSEEALNTYKEIFNGTIEEVNRFGDGNFPMPEEQKNRIMHARLTFGGNTIMMSDCMPGVEVNFAGSAMHMSIGMDDEAQTRTVFEKLGEGGKVDMPLEVQFWGALYGQVTDRFGIQWMLNCELKKETAAAEPKIVGIGGIFFKSKDPKALNKWYAEKLSIPATDYGANFEWLQAEDPSKKGMTVWSPFADNTKYFEPSEKEFMLNYQVEGIEGFIEKLRSAGVTILDDIADSEYGKFVHILDLEGNKIELWEQAAEA